MNTTPSRRDHQVLLAWREPHNTALWRALRARAPLMKVTFANPDTLAAHLGATDYYHVLHLSPVQWRAYSSAEQHRVADHIPLIILGPEAALAEDLACARGGLYFPETQPLEAALDAICEFHAQLAEGRTLENAAAATRGLMALVGNARCLDAETATASGFPNQAPTVSTPTAPAVSMSGTSASIAIGQINVQGDAVVGNKHVQTAGGDQVNINRAGGAFGEIPLGARGAPHSPPPQALPPRVCRSCGRGAESGDHRFCMHCGARLEDMS